MKLISNPFSPTPASMRSHVRGWAMHWADCLGADIADKEQDLSTASVLYIDHGVNFGGSLNLFGGVTSEIVTRIEQIIECKGDLVSLDLPMPDYATQLQKRIGQATCHESLTASLIDKFRDRLARSATLTQSDLDTTCAAIGDSHSTAFAAPRSSVLRTNGQTLYGALTKQLIGPQLDALGSSLERVTLVYGSIDIRHHLMRRDSPWQALDELGDRYGEMIRSIKGNYLVDVEVAAPVPVEHEGRKLPQTGYFQGTPFFGTREHRLGLTYRFIEKMHKLGVTVVSPPDDWYSMDGEQYAKTYMEMGGSVHIAPMFYRRLNWGQS